VEVKRLMSKLGKAGRQCGVTLLELLVALMVMMVGLFVIFNLFPRGFSVAYKARSRAVAFQLARFKLEQELANIYTTSENSYTNNTVLFTKEIPTISDANLASQYYYAFSDSALDSGTNNSIRASEFYYRVEYKAVSDPNLLYLDHLTRRVTVYVTIPPLNPQEEYSRTGTFSEKDNITSGKIVVLAGMKTQRMMQAPITKDASKGDAKIYVGKTTDTDPARACYYFSWWNTDSSLDDGNTNSRGGTDEDYNSSYYSYDPAYQSTTYNSHSVKNYPYEILNDVDNDSDGETEYVFNWLINSGPPYYSKENGPVDPANFNVIIANVDTNGNVAKGDDGYYQAELNQVVNMGNDSDGYYLTLGRYLTCAHGNYTAYSATTGGAVARAFIYLRFAGSKP